MPQSLAQLFAHLVFSTKNREPLLDDSVRDELHAYVGGVLDQLDGALLRAGSVNDHIHLLVSQPRTTSPADLVLHIKTASSKWMKAKGRRYAAFHWQNGYGIFSISPAHRAAVQAYIDGQAEHHRTITFQDEYRQLLRKYGIEYDERYVWD